jgi:xanthine/uracil permease
MSADASKASGTQLAIGVDDRLPVGENFLYGLHHVFVLMMSPLITPIIFAGVFQWDINITAYLVMIMIVGAVRAAGNDRLRGNPDHPCYGND